MNEHSLVSVVIPCYQQASYLHDAIRSVLAQTYQHFEIIVVDDGSPDETAEVAHEYASVRFIRQPNLGASAARNAGLRQSTGHYIVFLDADDRLLPRALETAVGSLNELKDCALVYGFCELIDERGALLPTPTHRAITKDHYRALFRRNFIWTPGAAMFRRSMLLNHIVFDESLIRGCEDWDLYLRVAKNWPVHCHGELVVQYRRHSASASRSEAKMSLATNRLFRRQLRDVKDDPELRELCRRNITPFHRIILQLPSVSRLTMALRIRTRLRSVRSTLQSLGKRGVDDTP